MKKRSKYAQKLRMKQGAGKVYVGWMWWSQSEGAPMREVTTVKPHYGDRRS